MRNTNKKPIIILGGGGHSKMGIDFINKLNLKNSKIIYILPSIRKKEILPFKLKSAKLFPGTKIGLRFLDPRNYIDYIKVFIKFLLYLKKKDLLLATGTRFSLFAMLVAKIKGIPIILLEGIERIATKTRTAKVGEKLGAIIVTPWKHRKKDYKNAIFIDYIPKPVELEYKPKKQIFVYGDFPDFVLLAYKLARRYKDYTVILQKTYKNVWNIWPKKLPKNLVIRDKVPHEKLMKDTFESEKVYCYPTVYFFEIRKHPNIYLMVSKFFPAGPQKEDAKELAKYYNKRYVELDFYLGINSKAS